MVFILSFLAVWVVDSLQRVIDCCILRTTQPILYRCCKEKIDVDKLAEAEWIKVEDNSEQLFDLAALNMSYYFVMHGAWSGEYSKKHEIESQYKGAYCCEQQR